MNIKVYTDGSCKPVPGTGGWAFIAYDEYDTKISSFGGAERFTNNYRMELMAVLSALKSFKNHDGYITILTDCAYVVDSLKKDWLNKWYHKKLPHVKQIWNSDLLTRIYSLLRKNEGKFTIKRIKGHSGIPGNIKAHYLARAQIKKFNKEQHNKKIKKNRS